MKKLANLIDVLVTQTGNNLEKNILWRLLALLIALLAIIPVLVFMLVAVVVGPQKVEEWTIDEEDNQIKNEKK